MNEARHGGADRWGSGPFERGISPGSVIAVCLRQWAFIIICTITIGVPLTLVILLFRAPQYQSTALLLFDRSTSDSKFSKESRSENDVDTQVELLNSISVVERVMAHLGAPDSPDGRTADSPSEVTPTKATNVWLEMLSKIELLAHWKKSITSLELRAIDVLNFQRQFRIRRRGLTDVISIEARASSPERAAKLANLYAQVFLAQQANARLAAIERIESVLSQRIRILNDELAAGGPNTQLRADLSRLSDSLAEVRQKRHVLGPELRIAAPALPVPILAFPSPRILAAVGWVAALGFAIALAAFRNNRKARRVMARNTPP